MALANITSKIRANIIAQTFHTHLKGANRLLDIGCGNGVVAKRLNEIFKPDKIEGCDIENYLSENISFKIQKHKDKLPYGNKMFDVAMFNDVLHHTEYKNQEKLIRESIRVAEKVILFELFPSVINKAGDYLLNKVHNPNMNIPFTYKTPDEWSKLLKLLGYRSIKINVNKPAFYPFNHVGFVVVK